MMRFPTRLLGHCGLLLGGFDADEEVAPAVATAYSVNALHAVLDDDFRLVLHILQDLLGKLIVLDGEVERYDTEGAAATYHSATDELPLPRLAKHTLFAELDDLSDLLATARPGVEATARE